MSAPSRHLIVMPDDGPQVLLDPIAAACKSLDVKMFLFTDTRFIDAVIAAHKRGVQCRVMLNRARRSGESDNGATAARLLAAGVAVKDANPAFGVTHEKSMVVDGRVACIKSLNWAPKNLGETRDYAVITTDAEDVAEVRHVFDVDWSRQHYDLPHDARLVWCKGNGRARMADLIDSAKHTLYLQNERYQDATIIEHIVRAHTRGVKVHVMAKNPHTLKEKKLLEGVSGLRTMQDVGIQVHRMHGLDLHAKMMMADTKRAIVGSINIAPGSFDDRRELGIEVDDHHVAKRLASTFEHDWHHSKPLDLSDEAIRADMQRHEREDAEIGDLTSD